MYVLDKDGNLVSAADVAKILQSAYNSDDREKLFQKYGVVGDAPRTSVSLRTVLRLQPDIALYLTTRVLSLCTRAAASGGGPEVFLYRLVRLRVDVVGDHCLRHRPLHRRHNTHMLPALPLEHVSIASVCYCRCSKLPELLQICRLILMKLLCCRLILLKLLCCRLILLCCKLIVVWDISRCVGMIRI